MFKGVQIHFVNSSPMPIMGTMHTKINRVFEDGGAIVLECLMVGAEMHVRF